jgi:hypothetical protein
VPAFFIGSYQHRGVVDKWWAFTGGKMTGTITHGVSLAEDKRTVRLELRCDGQTMWDDLAPEDVDLLIDALREMREQMPGRTG